MSARYSVKKDTFTILVYVLFGGLLLSSCASDRIRTGSIGRNSTANIAQLSAQELDQAARSYDQLYRKNPKDRNIALQYAAALRKTGRKEQSLAVMQKAVINHPNDNAVLSSYGKALAEAGRLKQALATLEKAQRPDSPDWRLYSAQGAILDQMGKTANARDLYRRALDLAPNEPSILSNMGMSYLIKGDARSAESHLRQAIAMPGADSQVRQNLALAVGLQGRFDEAEQIASHELSPQQAQANIAFLRNMLTQENAWNLLKQQDKAQAKQ